MDRCSEVVLPPLQAVSNPFVFLADRLLHRNIFSCSSVLSRDFPFRERYEIR